MKLFIVLSPHKHGRQTSVTFRAITAVNLQVTAFWHTTPCSFEGTLFCCEDGRSVFQQADTWRETVFVGRLVGVCVCVCLCVCARRAVLM
jgi:hypothetical protein